MPDLTTLTTPRLVAPLRLEADIPDGWQQGRGAFGGLVMANLIRALEAGEPAGDRHIRSVTAELCGPVLPGPAEIVLEVLRRGSGVTTLAARLLQGGEVLAHAVGVLGRARAEKTRQSLLAPPDRPPWRDAAPTGMGPPEAPTFAPFLEFRNVGPAPYSRAESPVASGWIRARDPGAARDVGYLALLADAWWPSILASEPAPRPLATISFTLEPLGGWDGLDRDAPLFHRGRVVASHDGYLVELRELWAEDGRLMALNQQTIALIR